MLFIKKLILDFHLIKNINIKFNIIKTKHAIEKYNNICYT